MTALAYLSITSETYPQAAVSQRRLGSWPVRSSARRSRRVRSLTVLEPLNSQSQFQERGAAPVSHLKMYPDRHWTEGRFLCAPPRPGRLRWRPTIPRGSGSRKPSAKRRLRRRARQLSIGIS
jgi:hypothetical protein